MLFDKTTKDKILKELPVGSVWGIGRRLHKRFIRLGISNAYQLSIMDHKYVKDLTNINILRTVVEL